MEHEVTLMQAIGAMLFCVILFLVAAALCTLEQGSY